MSVLPTTNQPVGCHCLNIVRSRGLIWLCLAVRVIMEARLVLVSDRGKLFEQCPARSYNRMIATLAQGLQTRLAGFSC